MEQLSGGMGNGGRIVRDGNSVRRPAGPHDQATAALLNALADTEFAAPIPVGAIEDSIRLFEWIDGDVGVPPFPAWVMTDEALASAGRLLRSYHSVAAALDLPAGLEWSQEMADPEGGAIICHNDVCPENVVYRDGQAIALLDFDLAAPGRPLWDLAQMARMWSPLRPPQLVVQGMEELDPFHRLGVLARAYGLGTAEHAEFVETVIESRRRADEFLRRRLAAHEPAFLRAWAPLGGERGLDSIQAWLAEHKGAMLRALCE
jgi:aminoglycoside phosphotransferase (APT) family kinase protein